MVAGVAVTRLADPSYAVGFGEARAFSVARVDRRYKNPPPDHGEDGLTGGGGGDIATRPMPL